MFPGFLWFFLSLVVTIFIILEYYLPFKRSKTIEKYSDTGQSAFLFILSLIVTCFFGLVIFFYSDTDNLVDYVQAYAIEIMLSIDNLLSFMLIFSFFGIKEKYQSKLLSIGILSSLIFRLLITIFGIYAMQHIEWLSLLLGLLLLYCGYNISLTKSSESQHFNNYSISKVIKKYFNYTDKEYGGKILIKKNNKIFITPSTFALILIEKADIIFALDSISAILTITKEPFIAFSANILATLGLRSVYFVIVKIIKRYTYIASSIRYLLIYTGIKIILGYYGMYIKNYISSYITVSLLLFTITISIIRNYFLNITTKINIYKK